MCPPRVSEMRRNLSVPYVGTVAPKTVPAWAAKAYTQIQSTPDVEVRAKLLSDAVGRSIEGCSSLALVFEEAAKLPGHQRPAAIQRSVPDTIATCFCLGVDVDALELFLRVPVAPRN